MEVGWRFDCLRDENFSKSLPGCGFMRYVLLICITHVVLVKSVFSVPLLRHVLYPMSDSDFEGVSCNMREGCVYNTGL